MPADAAQARCITPSESGTAGASVELVRFSTDSIEERLRLDYWLDAVGRALQPIVSSSDDVVSFHCAFTIATLDELSVVQLSSSAHESARTRQCLARDVEYSYHLMADFRSPWTLNWRGTDVVLRPGDLILTDSRQLHGGRFHKGCSVVNIKMPPRWASAWLQNPERFAGRLIARDVGWGRALSSFASQINPDLAASAPLPPKLIAQNLGSLLSLVECELLGRTLTHGSKEQKVADRVIDMIRQRASEPGLTAPAVALALGISERTLHRNLAGAGLTFGAVLIEHRIELAKRMLNARHFDRLTTGEIGVRAGFSDPSYFVRSATRFLGVTPARYRSIHRR